ncbi:MAG: four helix bundle protein [Thermodesulfovibrionales bacterium]
MGYESFKELRVWQEAKVLAVDVYKVTAKGGLARDYGLKDQMQRAAVSIASNIAERYERNSDKEFIRFLMIAKGSVSELRTQLDIAREINYIAHEAYDQLEDKCNKIGSMLIKLIQARNAGE